MYSLCAAEIALLLLVRVTDIYIGAILSAYPVRGASRIPHHVDAEVATLSKCQHNLLPISLHNIIIISK